MKRALGVAAVLVVSAVSAQGSEITPSDVVYEDGAVAQSLTGVAGNAEEGAKIMNKGAGNCIACHEVTALSHLPFHGEVGPMLDGAADRWSEAELRGIVANAKMMFDGTVMPSFYKTDGFVRLGNAYTGKAHEGDVDPLLSAQQIEDVVAYLMTLTDE
ncbi:sulfur oxidation c-type cytochrome SoxX [Shimia sp. MIT1388]|uniref:sulfur oxidation c-type cytochrome SoxX n=1 Tax=Shimia sp. MIT1388 TaxID=3096992 RepID=UPI00399B835B